MARPPILPPAMLGILGGGQLGMMFTLAAQRMGYRVTVLDPDVQSPAARFADVHICEAFNSSPALEKMAQTCAAVTTEFENVSADSMRWLAGYIPVHPSGDCVAIAQDRIAEKNFIRKAGLNTAPFLAIQTPADSQGDLSAYLPGILKTARLGYDGKGQIRVTTSAEVLLAHAELEHQPCVLEKRLALNCEISVTVARSATGETAVFPPAENQHANGILDVSIVPARVDPSILTDAMQMAATLIEKMQYVGVLAVEFFVLDTHTLVVNEMAPRPHNSAHFTLDATLTSQFEQQVRTLCNLPPGRTELIKPCVMVNLLGECWHKGEPNWEAILNAPNVKLHLYGKQEARPGRKMGHYTVLHDTVTDAFKQANAIKETL